MLSSLSFGILAHFIDIRIGQGISSLASCALRLSATELPILIQFASSDEHPSLSLK